MKEKVLFMNIVSKIRDTYFVESQLAYELGKQKTHNKKWAVMKHLFN